ncbi:MAG: hypothetical protein Q9182_006137 [Xanthomendoza sp. 2 TL-2023]
MAPDASLVQWTQMDKHDLTAAKHAEAQRRQFEQRRWHEADEVIADEQHVREPSSERVLHHKQQRNQPDLRDKDASKIVPDAINAPLSSQRNPVAPQEDLAASGMAHSGEIGADGGALPSSRATEHPSVVALNSFTDDDHSSSGSLSDPPSTLGDEPSSALSEARGAAVYSLTNNDLLSDSSLSDPPSNLGDEPSSALFESRGTEINTLTKRDPSSDSESSADRSGDEPPSTLSAATGAISTYGSRSAIYAISRLSPRSVRRRKSGDRPKHFRPRTPASKSRAVSVSLATRDAGYIQARIRKVSRSLLTPSAPGFPRRLWTGTMTTLSAVWWTCQAQLARFSTAVLLFGWTLPLLLLGILSICCCLGLIFEVTSVAKRIGTTAVLAVDGVTAKSCKVPVIRRVCSYSCGSMPTIISDVFPQTCSKHSNRSRQIAMGPYWEAEVNIDDINNIPHLLNWYKSRCELYMGKIERLVPGTGVSEEEKSDLIEDHDQICLRLDSAHTNVPNLYRHVSFSSAVLLSHIDRTDIEIEKSLNGSSQNALADQQKIRDNFSGFVAFLQTRYAEIEGNGTQIGMEVDGAVGIAAGQLGRIQSLQKQNVDLIQDKIRTWGLARRSFRAWGLLIHEPVELRGVGVTSATLADYYLYVRDIHGLFFATSNNVTDLNAGLKDLALRSQKSDVDLFLGPDGMLELRTWYYGMKIPTQKVQKTIGGGGSGGGGGHSSFIVTLKDIDDQRSSNLIDQAIR